MHIYDPDGFKHRWRKQHARAAKRINLDIFVLVVMVAGAIYQCIGWFVMACK